MTIILSLYLTYLGLAEKPQVSPDCARIDVICEGEMRTAIASYYTVASSSTQTASGEEFRDDLLTVAHRTLPFGTLVHLCHDGCVVARVTDRGPFITNRTFDLSLATWNEIGCPTRKGICEVEYQMIK